MDQYHCSAERSLNEPRCLLRTRPHRRSLPGLIWPSRLVATAGKKNGWLLIDVIDVVVDRHSHDG